MATMLAFITTDAQISEELLQEILADKTETTFNGCIPIYSDLIEGCFSFIC
jgi:N-acetylglutamate synthase/N-acetylornithine aminotransferase